MTLARTAIREMRDHIQKSVDGNESLSISIAALQAMNALDMLDACMSREGLDNLYKDCVATVEDGQNHSEESAKQAKEISIEDKLYKIIFAHDRDSVSEAMCIIDEVHK